MGLMKCNTCEQEFYSSTKQNMEHSHGCAATLYLMNGDFYIIAQYGSFYDMQKFALKKDKYKTGNICDDCI
jgi:hypothetical protein